MAIIIAKPDPNSGKAVGGLAIWVAKWKSINVKKIRFPKMWKRVILTQLTGYRCFSTVNRGVAIAIPMVPMMPSQ